MKRIMVAITALLFSLHGFSQSEKYNGAMTSNIATLDTTSSADGFLDVAGSFERIAEAEKTQWLPFYYASYSQILSGLFSNDPAKFDAVADKSEQLLKKAEALQANNSEISVLKSLIALLHMLSDPQTRWQQYGPQISEALEEAKKQDSTNPRPYFVQGQNLKNTPVQFGGGCTSAKPILEEAATKYASFKPASPLHPNWGLTQLKKILEECK